MTDNRATVSIGEFRSLTFEQRKEGEEKMKTRIAVLSTLLAGMIAVIGCGAKKAPTTAPAPVTVPVAPKIEDQFLGQWEFVKLSVGVTTKTAPRLQTTVIVDMESLGTIDIEPAGFLKGSLNVPSEDNSGIEEFNSVTGTWELLKETSEVRIEHEFKSTDTELSSLYLKYRFEDDKNNNTRYLYLEGRLFDIRSLDSEAREEFERRKKLNDEQPMAGLTENSKITLVFKQNLSGK